MIKSCVLSLVLLVSSTFGALVTLADEPDDHQFVEVGAADQETMSLAFGAKKAPVLGVRYDDSLDPDSLRVFLGEKDISTLFNPRVALEERVMLPLYGGKNVLLLRGVLWRMDEASGRHVPHHFEQTLVLHRDIQMSVQPSFKTAERPLPVVRKN